MLFDGLEIESDSRNMSISSKLGQRFFPLARRMQLPMRLFPFLILFNIIWIAMEGVGISLLLPVFELLRGGDPAAAAKLPGWHWDILRDITAFLGLQLTLSFLLLTSFMFLVLRQILQYLNTLLYGAAKRRTANRIRSRAFRSFLRARTPVQERIRIGEVANELTVELERALSSLFSAARAFGTLLHILIYVGGLFLLSPLMTALSIGTLAVLGVFTRGLFSAIRTTGAAITDANTAMTGFIVDRMQRARLIRLSDTEKAESAAFRTLSRRQAKEDLRHSLLAARLSLIPEPIAIGFAYTVLIIGSQVFAMSIEALGLFVIVLARLMPVVKNAINDYNKVVGKWPAVVKVDRRMQDLIGAREDKGGENIFVNLNTDIVYDGISFSYGAGNAPALSEISVVVPAHRMSALVGPSGAGKSTFVDLLPRLRDPTSGAITFDGVPTPEFSMHSLRAGIAFVPQEPQIFDSTAAEHIRYGKEDASDDEVREAARLAGALKFIEALPDGFDTLLGDGGNRLSGGQRQRLDIARALVRRAPILVLDEPTSALDAEAEAAFRGALRTLRRETNLTIIVIAHRLSTIADADQVVVLREGRLEAVGTHDELLAAGGWYADAYAHQVGAREPRVAGLKL